jgi:formylglycine-generating enzyme
MGQSRAVDGRIWPWGNQGSDDQRCNFNRIVIDTTPVGQYSPAGDSRYGSLRLIPSTRSKCRS